MLEGTGAWAPQTLRANKQSTLPGQNPTQEKTLGAASKLSERGRGQRKSEVKIQEEQGTTPNNEVICLKLLMKPTEGEALNCEARKALSGHCFLLKIEGNSFH